MMEIKTDQQYHTIIVSKQLRRTFAMMTKSASTPVIFSTGMRSVASCVPQRRFEPIPDYDTPDGRARLHDYLVNRAASAMVSMPDRGTPMVVDDLKLGCGYRGNRNGRGPGRTDESTAV